MREIRPVAVLLVGAMLLTPSLQLQAEAESRTFAMSPPEKAGDMLPGQMYFERELNTQDPAGVCVTLIARSATRKLNFQERMDLAMSYFLQQQWDRAAGLYQSTAATLDEPGQKAAALTGAAQCLAAAQRWQEAGTLMNQANQLVPGAKSAAALRYAYWANAGDLLEMRIAADRMKQLNLGTEGRVVCDPGTVIVASLAIVAISAIVIKWVQVTKPSATDMKLVGRLAFAAIVDITSVAISQRARE